MDLSIQIPKCNIIYELFHCDVFLFDSNDKNVYTPTSNITYPQFFKGFISNDIAGFLQQMMKSETSLPHYYSSSYFLCFIGISLWTDSGYDGAVIIGPFLEDEFNLSQFTSLYSSQLNQIGPFNALSSFYNGLTTYSCGKCDKLIALLNSFFTYPLAQQVTKYITSPTRSSCKTPNPLNIVDDFAYWRLNTDVENQLMKSLGEGNIKETMKILEIMKLNTTSQLNIYSIPRLKYLLSMANSYLSRVANRNRIPGMISYTLSAKFSSEIDQVSTQSEFNHLSTRLFKDYVELIAQYPLSKYPFLINKAISIIDMHTTESITLIDIAKELHVSPAHLSRTFKSETRMTITDYIHKTKIDTAIELIKLNRYSLLEVSQSIGYVNYSHFNKWFKKYTGVSPKYYVCDESITS